MPKGQKVQFPGERETVPCAAAGVLPVEARCAQQEGREPATGLSPRAPPFFCFTLLMSVLLLCVQVELDSLWTLQLASV